ncbi:MAG: FecR domain-containing protein [Anaerolineae bacterium]
MRWKVALIIMLLALLQMRPLYAQSEYAATLEVLNEGVEVQRAGTSNPIQVKVEAIVGVGDLIRTNASGRARITFFSNGVDTELLPNTEYRINQFEVLGESYNISAEVLVGETVQRLERLLDSNSSYDINTPSMALVARGTEFRIRVGDTGRAAMLVSKGVVKAGEADETADVPPGFGIRRDVDQPLSDVVQATDFDTLDSALDGCHGTISVNGDVSLNVRLGAGLGFPRIATVDAADITQLMGKTEANNWYRIDFRGGFAWVQTPTVNINDDCAGLRVFPADYGPEDISLYQSLGNPLSDADLLNVLPTPDAIQTP